MRRKSRGLEDWKAANCRIARIERICRIAGTKTSSQGAHRAFPGSFRVHGPHRPWVGLANFWTAWAPLSIIDAKKPKELRDWSSGSVTPLGTANFPDYFQNYFQNYSIATRSPPSQTKMTGWLEDCRTGGLEG